MRSSYEWFTIHLDLDLMTVWVILVAFWPVATPVDVHVA